MLKMKLQPTMKLGPPPPFGFHAKRTEDAGTSSEDDGLPRSPPEMSLLHEVLSSGTTTRVSSSGVDKNQLFYLCVGGRINYLVCSMYRCFTSEQFRNTLLEVEKCYLSV